METDRLKKCDSCQSRAFQVPFPALLNHLKLQRDHCQRVSRTHQPKLSCKADDHKAVSPASWYSLTALPASDHTVGNTADRHSWQHSWHRIWQVFTQLAT